MPYVDLLRESITSYFYLNKKISLEIVLHNNILYMKRHTFYRTICSETYDIIGNTSDNATVCLLSISAITGLTQILNMITLRMSQ